MTYRAIQCLVGDAEMFLDVKRVHKRLLEKSAWGTS